MENFLCISNYNHDVSWLNDYPNKHIIYDRSDNNPTYKGKLNIIQAQNIGYNLHDYFTFIIDNYDKLPEYTTFCKGNIFPRHMFKSKFEQLMNNKFFTPLFDSSLHHPKMPICMFSSDGAWCELNNGISLPDTQKHPVKYFYSYNDLLHFLFEDAIIPNYITFAAGGNYVVPREMILKYSVNFYKNLRFFLSHTSLPAEAHLIERALYTIWMCNFKPSQQATNELVDGNFVFQKRKRQHQPRTSENIEGVSAPHEANRLKLHTIYTIKLRHCTTPFIPTQNYAISINEEIFNMLFADIQLAHTQFSFDEKDEAEEYLALHLLPHMKAQNAIFAIEEGYRG